MDRPWTSAGVHRWRWRLSLTWSLSRCMSARSLPTVRFSGVTDAQLRSDVREYLTVYGCARALTTTIAAVTVPSEIPFRNYAAVRRGCGRPVGLAFGCTVCLADGRL